MKDVLCGGARWRLVVLGALLGLAMAADGALAEEKQSPEEQKLAREALELNDKAVKLYQEGKVTEVLPLLEKALAIKQRLYPVERFPNGHAELAIGLDNLASLLRERGELARAQPYCEQALAMFRRLYPEERFPNGHPQLASSLNNLGALLWAQGELPRAQPYFAKALAMYQRLYPEDRFPDGHPQLAASLNNLGFLLKDRGEYARAQPYFEQALAMEQRLHPRERFPQGHPDLAHSLNNLAGLLLHRGEYGRAQTYYEQALAMYQRLYPMERFPNGHPNLAISLNDLGSLLQDRGDYARAQTYYEQALAMNRRLYPEERFPNGHPQLAISLHNLGSMLLARGELAKAHPYYEKALAMRQRLYPTERFPNGHPDLANSLINLGGVLWARGELAGARTHFEKSLGMQRRLADTFADLAAEAETLNFLAVLPPTRDAYLTLIALRPDREPDRVYSLVWRSKGILLRALTHRTLLLRQAPDRASRDLLQTWRDTRRELAQLTLTPAAAEPAAVRARQGRLDDCTRRKEKLERELAALLPDFRRQALQSPPEPDALRDRLPADAAFLDLFRYRLWDAKERKWGNYRYTAFVLRHGHPVRQAELEDAGAIENAMHRWRQALAAQGRAADDTPSARDLAAEADRAAAELRRLVWRPLASLLGPARRVWVCPDGPLAALPFAALPGDKPGTILLEDYTFTTVPHGPALLDWLQQSAKERSGGRLLLVGGVEYGAPGKPWQQLPASGRERDELAAQARELKSSLEVTSLGGTDAAAERVLRGMREARWAHLATHGFFAAEESKERDKLYERSDFLRMQWGERTGAVARNPLTLSGLVLAGANKGGGAGLLTAEALAGEDLRGLELAVLSACQTGLGEADTAEGVFGLQRALHLAGVRGVVASLWRVDDEATAALMAVFYRKLWGPEKLPPAEALRQAQLALYCHPTSVAALARSRGPDFDKEYERAAPPAKTTEERLAPKEGQRLPAKFWAGFVLSGPGR
jgi:CHAT domain-containing protein/Tfp pilus assembly protein PilF